MCNKKGKKEGEFHVDCHRNYYSLLLITSFFICVIFVYTACTYIVIKTICSNYSSGKEPITNGTYNVTTE